MRTRKQWILVRYVPLDGGKIDKLPVDHRTCSVFAAGSDWQNDPTAWTTYEAAQFLARQLGPDYGIGFFFTPHDPYFFFDVDNCLTPAGWSPLAIDLLSRFPGAFVEVSRSGRGLHVFGSYRGLPPDHSCKNISLSLELYTESRFVAFTDDRSSGNPNVDCTLALQSLVAQYFPPAAHVDVVGWSDVAIPEYTGPEDDEELITKMLGSKQGAGAVFGGRAGIVELWNADVDALSVAYPDAGGQHRAYDASSADAALAQHLAFWTGKNHERILRLMQRSALVRDKWGREDYLTRTITGAVNRQTAVYSVPKVPVDTADKLRGTERQSTWAQRLKAERLAEYPAGAELFETISDAAWWINNRDKTGEQLAQMLTPIERPSARPTENPEFTVGHQVLGPEQQVEHFRGCIYVQDAHRAFVLETGTLLKPEVFNATFGGYDFPVCSNGKRKPTQKAWEAFTESQLVKYPVAESTCFMPSVAPGEIVNRDGRTLVNVYVPIQTPRRQGDPHRFLDLLARLVPNRDDQAIVLAYLAAIVQHKGVKFQWAPLIQGTEGNGKSFLTEAAAAAIGERYYHSPRADEIGEKFNEWLFGKLLIGVEDIYIAEQKRELIEILKPMITARRYVCRAMQQAQVMKDICCNFIFNSNHRDAVRKTADGRRFAIFYTAQQCRGDIERDGMGGQFFPSLYDWARAEGFAIIHDYLATYNIPEQLNPAYDMHRAPRTSSTSAAVEASLGSVEQQILEAIDEGRPGFAGGWISSAALDSLLKAMRRDNAIPINKRRELLQDLGYDWHPSLRGGRVNNVVMPDASKPRLFIRKGHIACNIKEPAAVAKAYQDAQGVLTQAAASFAKAAPV